ncbi:MAG: hypothetical protein AAGD88_08075 [Bacteroidota bacterium]
MQTKTKYFIILAFLFQVSHGITQNKKSATVVNFSVDKDLLLAHYDCKTDVDDLHSVAALATLLTHEPYAQLKYHAVAGTYGIQDGLYVPPNELFQLAFGDNWSDAHKNRTKAIATVKTLVKTMLENQGHVWIAEAGQSDFSSELIKAIQREIPEIDVSKRIHLVQHSNWNEDVTTPSDLDFVKATTDYQKIPDGNALGNGTPGFQSAEYDSWADHIKNPELVAIWEMAIVLGNQYNGKKGRYLNKAIAKDGLDFSDFSEVCWILNLKNLEDVKDFFERYGN